MNWPQTIAAYFEPGGWLQSHSARFVPRSDQIRMAQAVAQAIEQQSMVVIEAGTGVGKTYAYLLPALLSGQKTLISTATKTLQDQLYGRDLPDLVTQLGLPIKTALLKGRGSYLCRYRMETARTQMNNPYALRALAKVERWALGTQTGDLSEVVGLDERSPVLPWVSSTRDNCLGSDCPQAKVCHVNLARREALAADVVVVNHHLFFADLVIRETGQAQLLPAVQTVIFDEAHQLNEVGIQFLGEELTSGHLLELARDALAAGLESARGLVDWQDTTGKLELAVRDWRLLWPVQTVSAKGRWTSAAPQEINEQAWQTCMHDMIRALAVLSDALTHCEELSPDFPRLHERCLQSQAKISGFLQPPKPNRVRWVEIGRSVRLVESPLEIADWMQERVWNKELPSDTSDQAAEPIPERSRQSFIFASATLGDEPRLRWFTEPMGLMQAQVLSLGSPFDYERQAAMYIPKLGPAPNQAQHSEFVADLAAKCVRQLNGRTMVLTTSLKALKCIAEVLQARFDNTTIEVLVQGSAPKRELVQRFRDCGDSDTQRSAGKGAVLVASASFWEGVDIAGQALMCVVIDKLPFPMPGDPWVQARSEQLESRGLSAFREHSIPAAAVALKQGAGRLIRQETDRGLLVVCDTRLHSMSYGKKLKAALPKMRELGSLEELQSYLVEIEPTGLDHHSFHHERSDT